MTNDVRGGAGARPPDIDASFVRALIENSADIVSVLAADGTLLFHYPPTVLGYQEGENFGRQIFDFVHPDDVSLAVERFAQALNGPGATEPFECRVRAADGSWRWMEIIGKNLLDDPVVRGVVINGHDISRRKAVLEELRISEQRFRSLVQHSTDIIAVMQDDGTLVYASPATESVLGYEVGALIGTNAFDLVHPDDLSVAAETFAYVLENPDAHPRLELRVAHADGSWRNIEYSASNRLADPSVRGVVLNSRDVTDRRHAEEVERERHVWFRSLVQHGSDIIVVVDAQGRVQYVSPSVEHIMGYYLDELLNGISFDFVHPDDLTPLATHFAAVLATPGYHGPYELRARHADGSWRWLEVVHTNQLDDPAVRGVVLNFRDVSERKEVEEQLAHQALHDSLTALPNRVLLTDRLDQAIARARRDAAAIGVVFLDLDRFKLVNDTRGHAMGDGLLVAVGRRLRDATRASDTVARFGGDEFVVVYEEVKDVDELVELGENLRKTLAEPFQVDGAELYVTISVGVSLGEPGCSAEGLLRDADAAMYSAKERGGNTVVAFDESIRLRAHSKFETERALRSAVEHEHLDVVYQPVVQLTTGRIVAMEALLRWHHPEYGTVDPGEFIGLAEETGLIVPIGARVLGDACRQLAEWHATAPELEVSVNVSAVQLRDPELGGTWRQPSRTRVSLRRRSRWRSPRAC
jgi:diguanylate cyclase (GGDEF)-like protein/PAS domain S-box-containing protein